MGLESLSGQTKFAIQKGAGVHLNCYSSQRKGHQPDAAAFFGGRLIDGFRGVY